MKIKFVIDILIILFFISIVSAISVGGAYSMKNPLEMFPGESKTITLSLQNRAGDGDITFRANVTQGYEVVSLLDKNLEYFVKGSPDSEVLVEVLVKIPKNAEIGKEYDAKIEFEPIAIDDRGEGMIQLAIRLNRYFKIKIVERTPEEAEGISKKNVVWIILGILVVIIVVVVIKFVLKEKQTFSETAM